MLKVLMAVGGSGGHLFPARQLTEILNDCEVIFAGHKLESTPFFDRKVPYHEIASSNKKPMSILKGLWQSLRLLWKFKPDVVVGFGSFHSFPILLASALLRKKIVLFEANCSMGKANRLFVPFAKKVALQFPIRCRKSAYVPLLPWVNKSRTKKYQKDRDRTTILVFGGSQGASYINRTFCEAAKLLTFPVRVIHLTGKEDPEVRYSVPATVLSFEEDMAAAYEVADMVVCRCGAGTTAELIRFQKPAVIIPYPYAYDHQRKNGEFLQKGVRMLLQSEASPERLAAEIEMLKKDLEEHKKALRQISFPQTVDFGALVRAVGEKK